MQENEEKYNIIIGYNNFKTFKFIMDNSEKKNL